MLQHAFAVGYNTGEFLFIFSIELQKCILLGWNNQGLKKILLEREENKSTSRRFQMGISQNLVPFVILHNENLR